MNDFFVFIIVIVAISGFTTIVRSAIVSRGRNRKSLERHELDAKRYEKVFEERLDKIEDRLANMETLVVEREKERKFDAL